MQLIIIYSIIYNWQLNTVWLWHWLFTGFNAFIVEYSTTAPHLWVMSSSWVLHVLFIYVMLFICVHILIKVLLRCNSLM